MNKSITLSYKTLVSSTKVSSTKVSSSQVISAKVTSNRVSSNRVSSNRVTSTFLPSTRELIFLLTRFNFLIIILSLAFSLNTKAESHYPSATLTETPFLTVRIYQVQERYSYGLKLLKLALSKLEVDYQLQIPEEQAMNEARGDIELVAGNIDVQWLSTTAQREASQIPVRVPIYRGILGLRLLLAKWDRSEELATIKSLDHLRRFTGGHGRHWGDLPVYGANGLKVQTHVSYEHLFEMLIHNRFDYFHRGANEIWQEAEHYQSDLTVVDKVMLFYPHPVYFFVTKKKPELAELIKKGLSIAEQDGSFKHLFLDEHQDIIERSDLTSRTLITLKNPVLPENSPSIDTQWWLPDFIEISK